MDKIVGKVLTLLALGLCSPLYTQITLRAVDVKGRPLQEIGVDTPFKIEVALEGQNSMQHPTIKGLEHAQINHRETSMQIINGHRSVKHLYSVSFDTEGTYTIGPAEIIMNNQQVVSPTITVTVTDKPVKPVQPSTQKKETATPFFARLLLDKHHAVVGEHVVCTLQIFNAEPNASLQEIAPPPFEGFTVGSPTGPVKSSKMHNGTRYTCLEWQWDLVAHAAQETLVVPAFRIDYMVPLQEDDGELDHLAAFFGPRLKRKRVYSNSASIDVIELPAYKGSVQGIGKFKQFVAHVKPAIAKEGDGIVCTLDIEGEGDLYQNEAVALTGMPPALKWYDSKTYSVEAPKGGLPKKCFEYIVQGLEAGTWEIPSQTFTYFELASRTYKTLETAPLIVTIISRNVASKAGLSVQNQEPPADNKMLTDEHDIRPLHTDVWYVTRERSLPFWLFVILLIAPVVFLAMGSIRKTLALYMMKRSGSTKRTQAFARARKQLKDAEKERAYMRIYPIFIELLAARFGVAYAEVSEDSIEKLLKKSGITDVQYGQWHTFFATIAGLVFAGQSKISMDSKDIFGQSYEWMNLLEDIL